MQFHPDNFDNFQNMELSKTKPRRPYLLEKVDQNLHLAVSKKQGKEDIRAGHSGTHKLLRRPMQEDCELEAVWAAQDPGLGMRFSGRRALDVIPKNLTHKTEDQQVHEPQT